MKKAWKIIKLISAGLFHLGKLLWVISIAAIIMGVAFAGLPHVMNIIETQHESFDASTAYFTEKLLENFVYHWGATWFFLTMLVTSIVVLVWGYKLITKVSGDSSEKDTDSHHIVPVPTGDNE